MPGLTALWSERVLNKPIYRKAGQLEAVGPGKNPLCPGLWQGHKPPPPFWFPWSESQDLLTLVYHRSPLVLPVSLFSLNIPLGLTAHLPYLGLSPP